MIVQGVTIVRAMLYAVCRRFMGRRNELGVSNCFFFNDTATTEIYTLSLHDALPISAAPPLFILPNSRCGSAPNSYTARISLRQRPRFLYCLFLVAAAPCLLY